MIKPTKIQTAGKANNHSLAKFLLGFIQHPGVFESLAKAKTSNAVPAKYQAGEGQR